MSDNTIKCPECNLDDPAKLVARGQIKVGDAPNGRGMEPAWLTADLYECGSCGSVFAVRSEQT